jgi:tripartite-type tricarboxylate transporter receptor subunit TctC
MKQLFRVVALAAVVACGPGANAQVNSSAYPSRPITMNVPYAAGGPLDIMVHVVADGLRGALGQAIVIENVPAPSIPAVEQPSRDHLGLDFGRALEDRENTRIA